MGDIGAVGAMGAQGLSNSLEDAYQRRMQAAIAQNNEDYRNKQLAQQDALQRLKMQELTDAATERHLARKDADQIRAEAQARAQLPLIPLNTNVSPETVHRMTDRGIPPEAFSMAPHDAGIPDQAAAPPQSLAEDPSQGPTPMPGTTANAPLTGLRRVPSPAETESQRRRDAMQQMIELYPVGSPERKIIEYKNATGQNPPSGLTPPPPKSSIHNTDQGLAEIQGNVATPVRDQNGNVVKPPPSAAGTRLVGIDTVNEAGDKVRKFVNPQANAEYVKPAGGTVENRVASAKAVNQTGDDIIKQLSEPKFAATVGPLMGNYNTLRDFLGNPPPEFSHLAGQIESFSLANMGVHGMRSVEGADKINKDLLGKRHTVASLIASIKGLQGFSTHLIENETKTKTKKTTTDSGTIRARDTQGVLHEAPAGTKLPADWTQE